MVIVTTISYDQLGIFIRDKQVSLENADLLFASNTDVIKRYLTDRLGSDSYVMGIRGRINPTSVKLLDQLDSKLRVNKAIIEVDVDDGDVLAFDVQGLSGVAEILKYGLSEEMVFDQLDNSIIYDRSGAKKLEVVCTPFIRKTIGVRITSLTSPIQVDAEGITFVKMS